MTAGPGGTEPWTWVRDVGETSIFVRGNVMCVVFTDDFVFGGPEKETNAAYEELHAHFGFSADSYKDRLLKEVLKQKFQESLSMDTLIVSMRV